MQEVVTATYTRQQSLVVDRIVDSLALEVATSHGGTKKPAVAQALKKHLHRAAQRLPSLAASSASLPLPAETEQVGLALHWPSDLASLASSCSSILILTCPCLGPHITCCVSLQDY